MLSSGAMTDFWENISAVGLQRGSRRGVFQQRQCTRQSTNSGKVETGDLHCRDSAVTRGAHHAPLASARARTVLLRSAPSSSDATTSGSACSNSERRHSHEADTGVAATTTTAGNLSLILAPAQLSQRGSTGVGLVDASMRELYPTGWTSNRARQLDWRLGAEWYEHLCYVFLLLTNRGHWSMQIYSRVVTR